MTEEERYAESEAEHRLANRCELLTGFSGLIGVIVAYNVHDSFYSPLALVVGFGVAIYAHSQFKYHESRAEKIQPTPHPQLEEEAKFLQR